MSTLFLTSLIFGVGCTSKVEEKRMPAVFDSRREAEKAATSFNCTGVYKMGNKWMPCATHGLAK